MAGIKAALSINREESKGLEFLPPVRCSCGKEVSHLWPKFLDKLERGEKIEDVLNEYQLRPCCRASLSYPEVYNAVGTYYDIDVIEGKAPITRKPHISDEIISYLRTAWQILETSQREPSQQDIAVFHEFLSRRPTKPEDLRDFWNLHQTRYNTQWSDRRDISREEFENMRQHTGLDSATFVEIFNFLADESRRAGLLRNMRLLRGVPPLPESKQPRRDEIRSAPHLISIPNSNVTSLAQAASSTVTTVAPKSITISNVIGGKAFNPDGTEIPFSSLPTLAPEIDNPIEDAVEILEKPGHSDQLIPMTEQTASPRLLKDVIRGPTSIKTPVGKPVGTRISTGLVDKQGRDVNTIREDPVTGVTLMPGVVVVDYVRVTEMDPNNPNKGIVPVLSRTFKAQY